MGALLLGLVRRQQKVDSLPSALRSGENRTTMHKCYTFLIFMVLLLPSLGLSR